MFCKHRRVKENEQKKKEAKEKGIKVDCKRKVGNVTNPVIKEVFCFIHTVSKE